MGACKNQGALIWYIIHDVEHMIYGKQYMDVHGIWEFPKIKGP